MLDAELPPVLRVSGRVDATHRPYMCELPLRSFVVEVEEKRRV